MAWIAIEPSLTKVITSSRPMWPSNNNDVFEIKNEATFGATT
jgi:hypothetical protein